MAINRNGLVLWEGESLIDGAPIVAIVTGLTTKSGNGKTGAMLQTWILRQDMAPYMAQMLGHDVSICGGCGHRPARLSVTDAGRCYVKTLNAPGAVFRAYVNGSYKRADASTLSAIGKGRAVRLGSYGDPAAVPLAVWESLIAESESHTGYTHQWRAERVRPYARFLMASADIPSDVTRAARYGFRSFLVTPNRAMLKRMSDGARAMWASVDAVNAVTCPASKEAGHLTTCADCRMCDGAGDHPSVRIIKH